MMFSGGWGSTKNRARGSRKLKVRWEVLGLQNPLDGNLKTSIEDIRQQALNLANAGLKQETRSPTAERNAKATTHALDNRGQIKRRADIG
jgi:hypothetical protein